MFTLVFLALIPSPFGVFCVSSNFADLAAGAAASLASALLELPHAEKSVYDDPDTSDSYGVIWMPSTYSESLRADMPPSELCD